ncbi:MAG: glycerol-3-phosphate dehydrogenase [Pseudomonadota bacterium]
MNFGFDLFVIGGGINGCGIARDAAGRGLSVGLAEMNDLGSATSSASTKLFHGGLRYLEYFEFRLVRESLIERETLLKSMPHISWPMRFVLPYHKSMKFDSTTPTTKLLSVLMPWQNGGRPAWLIRLGLFFYDNLGGRKLLPATSSLNLRNSIEGAPLNTKFEKAFEYSDCWVEDSRLVVLNARDAEQRGAKIMPREKVVSADVEDGAWTINLQSTLTGSKRTVTAKMVVNAAGPWVGDVLRQTLKSNAQSGVRLVRGSHIVTKRLFDHDKCYFFQGTDGRIIFAIPYETDFTLIGTTDADHESAATQPTCTAEEQNYLIKFMNAYLAKPITDKDVVWKFSGVRPLYDDGAKSATAATRDYVLELETSRGAPALNVYGGKITTYRRLAENALDEIKKIFPDLSKSWTADAALPGGDFPISGVNTLCDDLRATFPFLSDRWALRLIRAYGTEAKNMLNSAKSIQDLGTDFGETLTEREVLWLMHREYAKTADDILWRRTKLGLRFKKAQVDRLDAWMQGALQSAQNAAAE